MSVSLLVGAAPSLRARAHAGCRNPVPDSEWRPPNAITGADIPNDTVLQNQKAQSVDPTGKLDLGLW
jgi:hypothetical protein